MRDVPGACSELTDPWQAPLGPLTQAAAGPSAGLDVGLILAQLSEAGVSGGDAQVTDIAEFRFASLIESLAELAAVVVFIDDLDRCLPETVVDTFEAIRLVLGAPRTAFVVAANQKIVESAVDARYPELRGDGRSQGKGIGAQYLEKMLQLKIAVPALAVPEAITYVNLLLAELHLPAADFARLREHVAAQRVTDALGVVFTLGTLGDLGIAVPPGLSADLQWAAAIAPVLARGSRGNPRQVKRFLNTLQLRRRAAERKRVSLEPTVLGKLMLLEDQHFDDFQQLFDWQGRPGDRDRSPRRQAPGRRLDHRLNRGRTQVLPQNGTAIPAEGRGLISGSGAVKFGPFVHTA